jgi:hypothetical protein
MKPVATRKNGKMKTAQVDGQTVNIGDWVGFKADIEQSGQIVDIKSSYMGMALVLENKSGFHGDYIGGDTITTQEAGDCWLEG